MSSKEEAARKYRSDFTPTKIVDAHLEDAFLAGVKWADPIGFSNWIVVRGWKMNIEDKWFCRGLDEHPTTTELHALYLQSLNINTQ